MADIRRFSRVDESRLRGSAYLQDLLREGVRAGILTQDDVEVVQMGCIALLAAQIEQENRGYSSSVPEETAQKLMASIAYTAGLGLKAYPDAEAAAEALKDTPIAVLHARGGARIAKLLRETRAFYKQAKENRLDVPNVFYNATLDNSLKAFFRRYDPEFASDESNFLPEYPLFFPLKDIIGVEFAHAYAQRLFWENRYCAQFPAEDLQDLFARSIDSLPHASVNLFRCVLIAAVGSLLLKGEYSLRLSEADVRDLYDLLQGQTPESVEARVPVTLQLLPEPEEAYRRYVAECRRTVIGSLCKATAQSFPRFRELFLAPVRKPEAPKTVFRAEERMPDGQYRALLEQLGQAKTTEERVQIVRAQVTSLGDLSDLLQDGAWSEDELFALFATLDDLSLAVLEKHAAQEAERSLYPSTDAYLPHLRKWIASQPILRQRTINQLIDQVKIQPF